MGNFAENLNLGNPVRPPLPPIDQFFSLSDWRSFPFLGRA